MIVSIPQDVFMASGATVKPSLLFFKKFTEEEALQYATIENTAIRETNEKYFDQIREIQEKLTQRGKEAPTREEKKQLKTTLKEIETKKEGEIKAIIKEKFNYEIAIAEVEKAGISTTGAKIENELEPLSKDFRKYATENQLWEKIVRGVKYDVGGEYIYRTQTTYSGVGEPEIFYSKKSV